MIITDIHKDITIQSYAPSEKIEGVEVIPLRRFNDPDGSFMEYMRIDDGLFQQNTDFAPRQISISQAQPGRINAFHIHHKEPQDEYWTVIQGSMLVWLVDCRRDSPTAQVKQKAVLTGEAPVMLYIPSGVAHGYKAGSDGATLVYTMNNQFNIDNPNEGRLPHDYFGANLWEDNTG